MLTVRKQVLVACGLLCAVVVNFGSGFAIGYEVAPQAEPGTVYVEREQTPEEWLVEREKWDALISSAQSMAATVEKERIQVCLLPDEYPENAGSWCKQTYYRNLVRAVSR